MMRPFLEQFKPYHFTWTLQINCIQDPWSICLCVQRITIHQIREDEWFKKSYVPVKLVDYEDVNLDDVNAAFDDHEVSKTF